MKKVLLTLACFSFMLIGASSISASQGDCGRFTLYCSDGSAGGMGIVCGETPREKANQLALWRELLC